MTRKQAEKLYCLGDGEKVFVIYNASPYVTDVESGYIEEQGEGEDRKYVYSDSSLCDIDVEEADVEDFSVYRKTERWW